MTRWKITTLVLLIAVLCVGLVMPPFNPHSVQGVVVDRDGRRVAGAVVRFKGTAIQTSTDSEGQFALPKEGTHVTASKAGFLIGGSPVDGQHVSITLDPVPEGDNAEYEWVAPDPDVHSSQNCGNCHESIFREWAASSHADSTRNPRFLSLYGGHDWSGEQKRGWSLVDEHPLGLEVCASCHAPGLSFDQGESGDMRQLSGVADRGVHCDFCHKIAGLASDDMQLTHGRFAVHLRRPHEGQLFFGPLDDVDRGEDAHSDFQSSAEYCATCHEGTVFGVHVYSTYSEWQQSPASRAGRTCQDCHMAPTGTLKNIAPGNGGIERDPWSLSSHQMMPGGKLAMLQRAVRLSAEAHSGEKVTVEVKVVANEVGHRVPTGFIDRHLLLVVEAFDAEGQPIAPLTGETLSNLAGPELEGKAGKIFGRLLVDEAGRGPVPFWAAGELRSDTRLTPGQPSRARFWFPAACRLIEVKILYRRFWRTVALEKQWPDDTVELATETIRLGQGR